MKNTIIFLCLMLPFWGISQNTANYNDVAVIVNDNSPESVAIGNYFQQKRNIPSQHIIHISTAVIEEVDSLGFEQIRQQIESALISNNIVDDINYIVLTKGIPHKVALANCSNTSNFGYCTSLDSELSLILGNYSNQILQPSLFINPYYNSTTAFSRDDFDIFLVSRLDGYDSTDVFNLIDRSAANIPVVKQQTMTILDLSDVSNSLTEFPIYNQDMVNTTYWLGQNSWPYHYDPGINLYSNQQNVLFYYGVNYLAANLSLSNNWQEGSAAFLALSNTASSFDPANNTNNDIVIADLVAEGVSSVYGSAYFVALSSLPKQHIFLERYYNESVSYNLAESYFASMPRLSWQNVIIGDPKMSIVSNTTSDARLYSSSDDIRVFPTPTNSRLFIEASNNKIEALMVYNSLGQLVLNQSISSTEDLLEVDLSEQNSGLYILQIQIEGSDRLISKKVVLNK